MKDKDGAQSELYRQGAALRRQLLGEDFVERAGREVYDDPISMMVARKVFAELRAEASQSADRPGSE